MRPQRKWLTGVLIVAALLICGWCSLLSGAAGWVLGSDIAARDTRNRLGATATAGADLPPLGVLVTRLERDGPAARGGLVRGDIIIALDSLPVNDARDLRDLLARNKPGDVVQVSVDRPTGVIILAVTLASFPDAPDQAYLGIYYTARAEEPADL